jgi:hypothetical protein
MNGSDHRAVFVSLPEASPRTIVIWLHGAIVSDRGLPDGEKQVRTLVSCFAPELSSLDPVILAPRSANGEWWHSAETAFVLGLVKAARERWPGAKDRVVVSGYSNGGIGAWYFARLYPEYFSAAIPVASNSTAAGASPLPVYAIHGSNDEVFPIAAVRSALAHLHASGDDVTLREKPTGSHFSPCSYAPEVASAARWVETHAFARAPGVLAPFPSRAELEALAVRNPTPNVLSNTSSVDSFEFTSAVPDPSAAYPHENHWDELLLASVTRTGTRTRPSVALRCAAQEIARFYVATGAYPDESVRSFLVRRCGGAVASTALEVRGGDITTDGEAAMESGFEASTEQMLTRQLGSGPTELGLGFARSSARAALVAVAARAGVRLTDYSPIARGAKVTIRGEVLNGADRVDGFVSQGGFGVARCEVDPRLRTPAFRIECPVSIGDDSSRIDITTRARGEVVLHLGASLLVRRSDDAGRHYARPRYSPERRAESPNELERALFEAVNQGRVRLGVRPLLFDSRQSASSERLAGRYFDSVLSEDTTTRQAIALGALAGWELREPIRAARLCSAFTENSSDPRRLFAEWLDSPLARWTLFDPHATRIAIGATAFGPRGIAALATTYVSFDHEDFAADAALVFHELSRERAALGRSALKLTPPRASTQTALADITRGSLRPELALNEALLELARASQRPMTGAVVETLELQELDFPRPLLDRATEVEIGVSFRRAPGAAWGQYVVLFVWPTS